MIRRWRRWRRRRLLEQLVSGPKVLAITGVFIGLLLLDTVTKLAFETPEWAMHKMSPDVGLSDLAILPLLLWGMTRLPAVIALAGSAGNNAWAFSSAGVPNPIAADARDGFDVTDTLFYTPGMIVQYNVADVCILLGGYATFACAVAGGALMIVRSR